MINQEVEGLLDSKAGKSVLANSAYTILMRQKPAVIDNICKTFHLSDSERTHLLTASVGEGLMIMEDDHTELKVIASSEEHKLITTNPNEKNKEDKDKKYKKKENIDIDVDPDDRFFRKSELNRHEINFLIEKGYTKAVFKSIVTNKKEEFLLQPRHNESLTHLFAVFDIAEYLEKKGFKVEKFATKKPDLVFKKGNRLCAIEVETGSMLSRKKVFEEKVKSLNKNYDEWFFVVTNRNKLKEYGEYGKSLDFRFLNATLPALLR